MTAPLFLPLASFMAIAAIVPYLLLHEEARRRFALHDALFFPLLLAAWLLAGRLSAPVALPLAVAFVAVVRIVHFVTFAVAVPRSLRRWSPAGSAAIVGLVLVALVPLTLRHVPDGDEAYYLLMTESIIEDADLDLANQYATLATSPVGRTDLRPQLGDPVGRQGELYSRHEPLLALLLLPGFAVAGVAGASVTMAIFGALLCWVIALWMDDEKCARPLVVWLPPLAVLSAPLLPYALRVWPEVPAAFFFTAALVAGKRRRSILFFTALLALALLKLRFVAVALPLAVLYLAATRVDWRKVAAVALLLLAPLAVVSAISGRPLNVHRFADLAPAGPTAYVRGFFGLFLDAQAGLLFQAPLLFLGLLALVRWRSLPLTLRAGFLAALPYLLLLVPRAEWHGGWSPPLRYVIVFMPLLVVALAAVFERVRAWGAVAPAVAWTAALTMHGLAYPWRLFTIASGESVFGAWLSRHHAVDFSRLFPSYIRVNDAAWVAAAALLLLVAAAVAASRWGGMVRGKVSRDAGATAEGAGTCAIVPIVMMLAIGGGYLGALRPPGTVHFEDAHVVRSGGKLYPPMWTVARFRFSGGWELTEGDAVAFRYGDDGGILRYLAPHGAGIEVNGRPIELPATGESFASHPLSFPNEGGRVVLTAAEGGVVLDRLRDE